MEATDRAILTQWSSHSVWTNIFYFLSGGFGFYIAGLEAWAPALALIGLGIGSGLHHKLFTNWTRKLDWLGMYLVPMAFPYYFNPEGLWWIIPVLLGLVLTYRTFWLNDNSQLNVLLINIPLVFFAIIHLAPWLLFSVLIIFGLALTSLLVLEHRFHGKTVDYLHGAWHILTSIGFGLMFLA